MTEVASTRSTSTGFPAVAVAEAVRTITDVAKYGRRHARSAFAQYLGHASAQSGPFKSKLAAYRDWGLVTTAPEVVELTPLAIRLALPPDPAKVPDDLLEAFRNCKPFVAIYDACAKGQKLELETIANMAVHRVGIAAAAKDKFVKSFAQSVVAVGLGEQVGNGLTLLADQRSAATRSDQIPEPTGDEAITPSQAAGQNERRPQASDAVLSLSWLIDGGEISFAIHRIHPLGSSAFGQVASVTAAIEDLVEALGARSEAVLEPEASKPGNKTEPAGGAVAA